MTMIKPPQADGLYDPRFEHDACGVAMVAKLDDVPAHDVIVRALEALDNLEHRGAEGADVRTGDGAGILTQIPDAFFRAGLRRSSCPSRGATAWASASSRATRRCAARSRSCSSSTCASRASASWAGATCRSTRATSARRPTARVRSSASSSSGRATGRGPRTRTPSSASSTSSAASSSSPRPGLLLAVASRRGPASTRACSWPAQVARLLPRPAGRALRERAGARALALQHEHLPQLGARPSVPRDRPQRRDQHADGQRQLDARPRVPAGASELFGGDLQKILPDRRARRLRLRVVRQRARAAHARRPLAAARGDDDDPRGLPEPRRPLRRAEGLLRLPLVPDGAVGRPRRRRASPTAASSARRSTATACVPAAGWRRRTAT